MIMRIVVDLPDPLGPRKPVTVPGRTSKDRSSTATTLPNRFESPRASITRSALHGVGPVGIGENPTLGGLPESLRPGDKLHLPTATCRYPLALKAVSSVSGAWPTPATLSTLPTTRARRASFLAKVGLRSFRAREQRPRTQCSPWMSGPDPHSVTGGRSH